jgi:hypothetical protein
MNKPNLWQPGIEYDFGDGVYGRRYTGTITANAGVRNELVLESNTTFESYRILNKGGYWRYSSVGIAGITHTDPYSPGYYGSMYIASNGIRLMTQSGQNRTSNPYDVWITYTK